MRFGATLESSVTDDWRGYAVDYSSLKLALKGQRRGHAQSAAAVSSSARPTGPAAAAADKPPLSPKKPEHRRVPSALRARTVGTVGTFGEAVAAAASSTDETERHANNSGRGSGGSGIGRTVSWDAGGGSIDYIPRVDSGGEMQQQQQNQQVAVAEQAQKHVVTKEDIEAFFRIYDNSKDRLDKFYEDKKAWALDQMRRLEGWLDPPQQQPQQQEESKSGLASGESSSEEGDSHSASAAAAAAPMAPDELKRRIDAFDTELDRVIEFLQLNQTAFSKILKKFDKNTGLGTREARLGELRLTHGFLDGALFYELKGRVRRMRLRAIAVQQQRLQIDREGKGGRKFKPTAEEIREGRRKRIEALGIDRAERYLRRMEVGSQFFRDNVPRQLPHFSEPEVGIGEALGRGEFSVVREVTNFDVKESCHLCFFHRCNQNSHSSNSGDERGDQRGTGATSSDAPSVHGSSVAGEETKEGGSSLVGSSPVPPPPPVAASGSGSAATTTAAYDTATGTASSTTTAPILPPIPTKVLSMPNKVDSSGMLFLDFDDNVSDYDDLEDDHDEELLGSRGFMKDHCVRDGTPRYAAKRLRTDLDAPTRREACLDLAIEAKFLSTLSHPNVVKMRGTSGIPGHSQFFIIMDRLTMNLTEKRDRWRAEKVRSRTGPFGLRKDAAKARHLWGERLTAVYDVARAMKYLHENNIVYRDLKPDNCGYDIRGDVKIFDFGLAKELVLRDRVGEDQYKASGLTGSRRYMAPEVCRCKPYGLSADVYSFGIFLWEILALREPFEDYDVQKHSLLVVKRGQRPRLKRRWPQYVKALMEACWAEDPKRRPTFDEVYDRLKHMPEFLGASLTMTERSRILKDRSVVSLYPDGKNQEK